MTYLIAFMITLAPVITLSGGSAESVIQCSSNLESRSIEGKAEDHRMLFSIFYFKEGNAQDLANPNPTQC